MKILRFILVLFLIVNIIELNANQIDIGISESSTIPGQVDIKIRPDFNIVTPQTVTAILYTIRWNDPSIIITTLNFYPFFISPIGQPEEYNGYYYQSFAAVPFNSVAINANQEYLASSFTFTNGDCTFFEIIEDEWTLANNGNLYLEFVGNDVSGIIYEPVLNFGSLGGNIAGIDTVYFGNSTGPMTLSNYQGSVLTWQRKIDDASWVDIPGSSGLSTYSETPSTIGSYNYRTRVQNGICPEVFSEILNIQVVLHEIELDLTVFLEGGFFISEMKTSLNQLGNLPLSQPYNIAPWNYTGSESVPFIPNIDVVDWILIELRETTGTAATATFDKRISRQTGFLLKNGKIVGIDGTSNTKFEITPNDNLYVVIWHRNHLSIMSSEALILAGNIYNYDFTSGESKIYGGSLGHKEIAPGVWCMMGGDGNADQTINDTDISLLKTQSGSKGYLDVDYNLDSQINNIDKNDIWYWNYGSESQVPE